MANEEREGVGENVSLRYCAKCRGIGGEIRFRYLKWSKKLQNWVLDVKWDEDSKKTSPDPRATK